MDNNAIHSYLVFQFVDNFPVAEHHQSQRKQEGDEKCCRTLSFLGSKAAVDTPRGASSVDNSSGKNTRHYNICWQNHPNGRD